MASIQKRGEKFQLRVKHELLPCPFFFTFDTEEEAQSYGGNQLESLLRRGIVPQEMLAKPERTDHPGYPAAGSSPLRLLRVQRPEDAQKRLLGGI
ncbi:hypothetical protein [Accumulibacter sp.]|uniref:hypothetical protein n=1 Tax=Accumulibacter sp. TaxID=2053492 RepID=UPI00262A86D6|nr:hypothetical protein [Accumulibacter sp.]